MKKLALDLDDTLVPLVKSWLKWLKDENLANKVYKPEEVTHYTWFRDMFGEKASNFFLKDPIKCYSNLRPIPGSQSFYIYCKEHFDTEIVTHANQISTEHGKKQFAKKWFGDDVNIRFFKELNDKYKSLKGCILVDDYPLHIINHIAHNKQPAILFNNKKQNGWGHMKDYEVLIKDLKPDMKLFYQADSYDAIIDILKTLS